MNNALCATEDDDVTRKGHRGNSPFFTDEDEDLFYRSYSILKANENSASSKSRPLIFLLPAGLTEGHLFYD